MPKTVTEIAFREKRRIHSASSMKPSEVVTAKEIAAATAASTNGQTSMANR